MVVLNPASPEIASRTWGEGQISVGRCRRHSVSCLDPFCEPKLLRLTSGARMKGKAVRACHLHLPVL